jgi:uncharacterized phage protein gp47/JayE
MAEVTTKTFTQLLQGLAAAVQGRAAGLVDFTVGSIARATAEAFAGVVLWIQGLILLLLATTRAATSNGADLDSFVADFGAAPTADDETLIERLGAAPALGSVTFSRLTTTGQVFVPVGATVATQDGSQSYVVLLDLTNGHYDSGLGGYTMNAGIGSVVVKVQALTAGAASNAAIGAINTITSPIPGVDGVTNAAVLASGADAETDADFRARFRSFIGALRRGTPDALVYAITSLQRGLTAKAVEGAERDGTPRKGFTYLIVDDGTGAPTSELLMAASAAVDAYHAAGTEFAVYAPDIVSIAVSATLVISSGGNAAQAQADAVAALTAFLNTLPIGQGVFWSRIWQVLHDSSEDIEEVTNLSLNGAGVDIAVNVHSVAKAGVLTLVTA